MGLASFHCAVAVICPRTRENLQKDTLATPDMITTWLKCALCVVGPRPSENLSKCPGSAFDVFSTETLLLAPCARQVSRRNLGPPHKHALERARFRTLQNPQTYHTFVSHGFDPRRTYKSYANLNRSGTHSRPNCGFKPV